MPALQPGPKNKIYRGGYQNTHPEQLELPAAAAGILPGHIVQRTADELAVHTDAGYFYIANSPPAQNPLTFVYEEGETVFGYVPRSRDVYLMRAGAGLTVAADAPLASGGDGTVVAAVGDVAVIGYAHFAVNAATAGTLIDVRIK